MRFCAGWYVGIGLLGAGWLEGAKLSGVVTPSALGGWTTMYLHDAATLRYLGQVVTGSLGNYSFVGLGIGTYLVTPRKVGVVFSPVSRAVVLGGADAIANFTAAPKIPPKVVLSWIASTSADVAGYYVYRRTTASGAYIRMNLSPVAALTFTDSSVLRGWTYRYVATAVDGSGRESTYSTEAVAVVPVF